MSDYVPDKRLWKSYVWHEDKCFFVSTIERTYGTYDGETRGQETLAWSYDWDKKERGKMIYQGGGILDHETACRCLFAFGEIPGEDDERWTRFHDRQPAPRDLT